MNGKYLYLNKGNNVTVRNTISQADMNAVAEQGVRIFQKEGDMYFQLRVRAEPGRDPRLGKSYEIDLWEPIAGVPSEVEDAAREANERDAQVQNRKPEANGNLPPQQKPATVASKPSAAAAGAARGAIPAGAIAAGVSKHDAAVKDAAKGMHASPNLKDTDSKPHDGQPAAGSSTPQAPSQKDKAAAEPLQQRQAGAQNTNASDTSKPAPQGQQPSGKA